MLEAMYVIFMNEFDGIVGEETNTFSAAMDIVCETSSDEPFGVVAIQAWSNAVYALNPMTIGHLLHQVVTNGRALDDLIAFDGTVIALLDSAAKEVERTGNEATHQGYDPVAISYEMEQAAA